MRSKSGVGLGFARGFGRGRSFRNGVGGVMLIAMHSCGSVSAWEGSFPVSSSKQITPSAQMSVRMSTARADISCSGDMYSGEPMTAVVLVIPWSPLELGLVSLEMPKSKTLMHEEPPARLVRNKS